MGLCTYLGRLLNNAKIDMARLQYKRILIVMAKDEMLAYMVENGLLSVPWHIPQVYEVREKKAAQPKREVDPRVAAYHKGDMSESELCNRLGIDKAELFRYLVDNGVLFY